MKYNVAPDNKVPIKRCKFTDCSLPVLIWEHGISLYRNLVHFRCKNIFVCSNNTKIFCTKIFVQYKLIVISQDYTKTFLHEIFLSQNFLR